MEDYPNAIVAKDLFIVYGNGNIGGTDWIAMLCN
jgi:hypothetical protein